MSRSLSRNIDLAPLTTFGVPARAAYFVQVTHTADLLDVLQQPETAGLPRLLLGGGSNLLFTEDFPGLVIQIGLLGMYIERETDTHAWVSAAAGERWHQLVMWSLAQGLAGLENLALIPGSVGAAPVQNIGAYGVELKDVFDYLEAVELSSGEVHRLDLAACAFAYRDSIFKGAARDQYCITRVVLRLSKKAELKLGYGELQHALSAAGNPHPTAQAVADAVIAIRQNKLPDPAILGNAGSFFKNPVVPRAQAEALAQQYPALACYPVGADFCKLAAGWLIDAAGWKGHRQGDAGVYANQALVLVNHGGASGAEIQQLATAIARDIVQKFGVQLEVEPVILPCP